MLISQPPTAHQSPVRLVIVLRLALPVPNTDPLLAAKRPQLHPSVSFRTDSGGTPRTERAVDTPEPRFRGPGRPNRCTFKVEVLAYFRTRLLLLRLPLPLHLPLLLQTVWLLDGLFCVRKTSVMTAMMMMVMMVMMMTMTTY